MMTRRRMLGAVCLIGVMALVGWTGFTALHAQRVKQRLDGLQNVVALVAAGKLRADATGSIRLPAQWQWLTRNGRAYQARSGNSDLILLFPTQVDEQSVAWGGRGDKKLQAAGYVYISGAAPADGWLTFAGVDEVRLVEVEPLRAHWYYAEPFYS